MEECNMFFSKNLNFELTDDQFMFLDNSVEILRDCCSKIEVKKFEKAIFKLYCSFITEKPLFFTKRKRLGLSDELKELMDNLLAKAKSEEEKEKEE